MPCRKFDSFYNPLVRAYESILEFQKIMVDDDLKIMSEYKTDVLPTVIIFKNGKIFEKIEGTPPNLLKFEKKIRNLAK